MADTTTETPLVDVRHLKEYFPVSTGFFKSTPLKAVDDVSFQIRRGETLGLEEFATLSNRLYDRLHG